MMTACFILSTLRDRARGAAGSRPSPPLPSSPDAVATTTGSSSTCTADGVGTLIVDRLIAATGVGQRNRPGLACSLDERRDNLEQHRE